MATGDGADHPHRRPRSRQTTESHASSAITATPVADCTTGRSEEAPGMHIRLTHRSFDHHDQDASVARSTCAAIVE
ncbi:hypothetical protein CJJ17_09135 [Gordonia polyisoprenivorans]|nr:hypothetical protein CJJ17_09135 [Gordonia polyisoprenivorans]